MNAAELFRLRVQSLLARGLAAPAIAARVRLAGASEVWGGDAPRERPAWYVWLRDAPGAWQLELAEAGPVPSGPGSAVVARFTVRHYPAADEAAFASFSPEERQLAAEAFDGTGAPRIELASRIPEEAFTVASLDWALDPESGAAVLAVSSLDRLRTRTAGGDVVRDVPGWRLGAPVFWLLAGLYAQVERLAATRLVVARRPGFERVVAGDAAYHRDAPDTVQGEALVLFAPERAPREAGARLLDALRDPEAELVADESFGAGHPPHALAPDPRLPVAVGHAWFGGEAHLERPTCAC